MVPSKCNGRWSIPLCPGLLDYPKRRFCRDACRFPNSMVAIYSPEAVFNQSPPLENYNLFDSDCALKEAGHREGGGWIDAEAHKLGELSGKPETINLGVLANRFTPELRTHDRCGYRIDEVTYHPAYHELMRIGIKAQTHSLPWVETRPGEHISPGLLCS